jgi:hypothetical protein
MNILLMKFHIFTFFVRTVVAETIFQLSMEHLLVQLRWVAPEEFQSRKPMKIPKGLKKFENKLWPEFHGWRHDTQYNNTEQNDTQHNDTQHKKIQTQHNNT